MLKKSLAVVGIAGALILGGAAGAAVADEYPVGVDCVAAPTAITSGATSTITCTGFSPDANWASFYVEGPGVTDSTLASTTPPATNVDKEISADGTSSATFTAPTVTAATTYTVLVAAAFDEGFALVDEVPITVNPAAAGGGDLPATGGTVPAAALWAGIGAVGIGGIAVTAAVARRRAAAQR